MKEDLLVALAETREREADLEALCTEEPPDPSGRWRPLDHLAHIVWLRERDAKLIDAMRTGGDVPPHFEGDLSTAIYEATHELPAATVISRAHGSWDELLAAVEASSEEDLERPHPHRPERKLIDGSPGDHLGAHLMWVYLEAGDEKNAEAVQLWARDLSARLFDDPRSRGVASYNLGCFYARVSRPAEAAPLLREGFELSPDLKEWAQKFSAAGARPPRARRCAEHRGRHTLMAVTLDRHSFPFTAIVGQDSMKLALILNAIVPTIGGVLIRGEKGTGKSTAVRALARLLPEHDVVEGCHFGCDPNDSEALCADCRERLAMHGELPHHKRRMRVVELPINASEDRVVGTIDIEAALRTGAKRFEPGVLAEANRNILYVDEVNLLDDHLVDVLLDAAAMGVNVVEREGVSYSHPSRFILVGTMNPEEGELRPQLLDRFGLCVDVEGIRDPDERVLIAERDAAFKRGDHEFANEFAAADANLSRALGEAIARVKDVKVTAGHARLISSICVEAEVLGHRADVVIDHAARALAAYRRHTSPSRDDIYDAATLALAHRARQPVSRDDNDTSSPEHGEQQEGSQPSESETGEPQASENEASSEASADQSADASDTGQQSAGADTGVTTGGASGHESLPEALQTFNLRRIDLPRQRRVRKQGGKRAASQTPDRRGRYVRAEPKEKVSDLAIDATVRAAAPLQRERGRRHGERLRLERHDLRQKVRERKVGNLIVFVVDASASMDAEQRMAATKGAILSLLQDAYVRRDRVAVVIFKNRTAEVVMRPTSSISLARKRLERLSVGGTTPLTHGLMAGYKVVKTELLRDPTIRPLLVLISDGRGNISMFKEEPLVEAQKVAALIDAEDIDALVIDSARDYSHLPSVQHLARVAPMYQTYAINACADLAERMGAHYYGLYDLSRDEIATAVERELGRSR